MEINFLFVIITLIIISIFCILYIFNRNYVNIETVFKVKPTKFINKAVFKSLLEIYDKNVISKTDLNGVIIHVS